VENNGAVALTSLTVTDTLPADVTFVSAAPAPSSVAGRVVTWSGLSLASGADMSLSITVTVQNNPGPTLLNQVEVEDANTGANDSDTDEDITASGGNLTKTMVATNQSFTSGTEVAIGEILTYQLTLTVPALGRMDNALLVDTLQNGLAFVDCADITASSGLLTSTRIDLQAAGNCRDGVTPGVHNPLVQNSGGKVTFDFGSLENGNEVDETLTIRYDVVVLDIGSNQDGTTLTNGAAWTWDGGQLEITTPPVEIIEPDLSIDKSAEPEVAPYGTPINFSIKIAHTTLSTANAYDVVVTDKLPTGLDYVPNSATVTGLQPTAFNYDAATKTLTFTWDDFPLNAISTIKFQATFVGPSPVTNESSVAWTSLPLDPGPGGPIQQSPYNPDSTERWYDPNDQSGIDGYVVDDSITIVVPDLPETGFAPHRVTDLPAQPAGKTYSAMDAMWLEVPKLGLAGLPIVGVPLTEDGWDLTWLSGQAGWLEGTAYPTWAGNTAITGHTYLADGTPGPFVNLFSLFWGDEIVIHANGQRYVYQVREVRLVWADDLSVLRHETYDWLTLITCKEFNELTGEYNYRVVVRAVLVSVLPGP
jgi:LPXTG-site transpeptidase (sortase) family protein